MLFLIDNDQSPVRFCAAAKKEAEKHEGTLDRRGLSHELSRS